MLACSLLWGQAETHRLHMIGPDLDLVMSFFSFQSMLGHANGISLFLSLSLSLASPRFVNRDLCASVFTKFNWSVKSHDSPQLILGAKHDGE